MVAAGVLAAQLSSGGMEDEEASPRGVALPNLTNEAELPFFPDIGLDDTPLQVPTDIPKEERKRRKTDFKRAACVGNVLGASVYEAGLALELRAAFEDCSEARRFAQELHEEDQNMSSVKELLSLQDILRLIRQPGKGHNHKAQTTTLSPEKEALEKAVKRQELMFLRAKCARDVASIVRDLSVIAALAAEALKNCGDQKTACGKWVAGVVKQASSLAQTGAELRIDCPADLKDAPDSLIFRKLDSCAEKLEKVGWESGGLFRAISRAEETCNDITERGNEFYDELSCAGNIIASAGYVGAAGLWLTSAVQRDCVFGRALKDVDMKKLKKEVSPWEYELLTKKLDQEKAECARDIGGFARTLGIAAWKATRASGWCGGFNSDCGVNILESASALFASSESSARTRLNCFRTDLQEDPLKTESNQVKCVISSASLIKELAVTAAFAIDARNSCPNTTFAAVECGSNIAKTLATLAYLTERSALVQRRCAVDVDTFKCGRALDDVGGAVNLLPRAIAGAVVNCGLGVFPRITKPLRGPRRFWVPA